jgi:metal-responsive CopG/Arc/MetJ family transcriptional regulator
MAKTMKTAITIPKEDYKIIESLRRKLKKSRSEIISGAVHAWLKEQHTKILERQYEEGYRKHPETPEEIAQIEAMASIIGEVWEPEDWSEYYKKWMEENEKR